jgi:membrane-bound metal-dependent hydrolase YbcI (DUF457 family)
MHPLTHMSIGAGVAWAARRKIAAAPVELDYRFAAFGALLPDLVDKPLKWFLFPDSLPDSHIYGHTLLFSASIILAGLLLARIAHTPWLLLVGLGSLTHPLVDPVLIYPETLFWPLLGTEFPVARAIPGYIHIWLDVAIIVYVAVRWRRSPEFRDRARRFVRTGAL